MVVDFQQVGEQHEQLVVVPLADGPYQRRGQDRDLLRCREQVAPLAIVQWQCKRHAMVGEKTLKQERELIVVLEKRF